MMVPGSVSLCSIKDVYAASQPTTAGSHLTIVRMVRMIDLDLDLTENDP